MVCKNCEKEVMDEAYYCPYCGEKLREYELEVPLDEETKTVENEEENVATETEEKPTNDMAIIGFVGAFVSPLLGFALGGIGLARSFKKKGAGRGFSIAALAVSAVSFLITTTIEACNLLMTL